MSASTFLQVVEFHPAFDKRAPEPAKNYGIHGVELRMVLKGPLGATQFLLFTNWHLPHVQAELDARVESDRRWTLLSCHPQPADLGYHARRPMYEGQSSMGPCPYLDGADCYYDGSGLNAELVYQRLLREGHEGVWKALETYYSEVFVEHTHA